MKHAFHPSYSRRHVLPIKDRIQAALTAAGGSMPFYALAEALYPNPDSHRAPTRGGPPGCYRALSAALDKHQFQQHLRGGQAWSSRIVFALGKGPNT
jgi:hypothetical protein